MRAAVLNGYNEPLVIEELREPALGPRDVRVQIDASGVCHSDLTVQSGGVPMPIPLILGHEGAGTVLETGPEVSRVRKGDRVIASFIPACGNCFFCLHEQSNLCEESTGTMVAARAMREDGSAVFGMTGLGTFSDLMTTDEASLVKIDTDLPSEQLALIGCGVTTGVGAALLDGEGAARLHCRGDRLRWCGSVRDPRCSHRGRVAHLRCRSRRDEAQDGRAVGCHRSRRSGARRSRPAGQGSDRRTRERLRVRGHRAPGDDPPGVQHRPARRHGGGRRHAAHRRHRDVLRDAVVLRREEGARLHVRVRAGARATSPSSSTWSRPAGSTSVRWCRGASRSTR